LRYVWSLNLGMFRKIRESIESYCQQLAFTSGYDLFRLLVRVF